jgi:ribosome biogenesis GTPase
MEEGLVIRSTGSWYEVLSVDKHIYQCRLRGKFKIKGLKVTNPIAVGDKVIYQVEDKATNTGIITAISPRENYIIRKSVHKAAHSHMLAANIDQAILMATLALPRTSLGFIDRFLVTAESFRIPVIIVFNKADLLGEDGLEYQASVGRMYEYIGYRCMLTSVINKQGIEEFKNLLIHKKSLLAGHSGVGKSSLINEIAPGLQLRTSEISTFANKGVHTTTFAEMFEIENDTYIIDTPGIKELGLIDIAKDELSHYFPEMRLLLNKCRFHNCTHIHEPGCAVIEAVENEQIALSRYYSYTSMLDDTDNRR